MAETTRTSGRRRPDQIPGGHHGLTPEEVAESQRTRILDAMRAAIAEHGYSDASVADVIKRAGVSRKTFYAQFTDKEDCFLAIYDEHMGRLQALTRDAPARDAGREPGEGEPGRPPVPEAALGSARSDRPAATASGSAAGSALFTAAGSGAASARPESPQPTTESPT